MKVGDLVIGLERLYRDFRDDNQLPRDCIGKITKIHDSSFSYPYLVEWESNRELRTNGYSHNHLRVVNFNVYLTQIEEC